MYGRTPAGLIVERPLRDGRIRSFDLVSKMLRYEMRKVMGKRAAFRPRLLLALPGGMVPSERQTLVDIMVDAGVRSVVPVDENVAVSTLTAVIMSKQAGNKDKLRYNFDCTFLSA